jgi:hypothetical protein
MGKGNQSHGSRRAESRNAESLDNRDALEQRVTDLLDRIGQRRRRDIWLALQEGDRGIAESQGAVGSDWGVMPKAARDFHVSGLLGGIGSEDTPDDRGHHGDESEFEDFDGVPSF